MVTDRLITSITDLRATLFSFYAEVLKEVETPELRLALDDLVIESGDILHQMIGIIAEMEHRENGRE